MDSELRAILADWLIYMEEMANTSTTDPEIRKITLAQVKKVRDKYMVKPEEDVFTVWKRLTSNLHEGKPLDMVDVIQVNNYMEEARKFKDGAKGSPKDGNLPAVPRRTAEERS